MPKTTIRRLPIIWRCFMNFWTGIIIGVIVGANIGIVEAGVLALSKRSNYAEIFQPAQCPMDEAAINDATA